MTREEIFQLIDQTIFTNSQRAIMPEDVNSLLKTIYDNTVQASPKIFRGLIGRNTVNSPMQVYTTYENTIGEFLIENIGTGIYQFNGEFPINKTFIKSQLSTGGTNVITSFIVGFENNINMFISNQNGPLNPTNYSIFLEILVFP